MIFLVLKETSLPKRLSKRYFSFISKVIQNYKNYSQMKKKRWRKFNQKRKTVRRLKQKEKYLLKNQVENSQKR